VPDLRFLAFMLLALVALATPALAQQPGPAATAAPAPQAPSPCENTRDQYAVILARLQTREQELMKALEDAAKKLAAAETQNTQPAAKPAEKK